MSWITKAKEGAYPKPYAAYLAPQGSSPMARKILAMIDDLEAADWATDEQKELADIAVESLGRLLESAYPQVLQKADAYAELERRARERAQEEGIPIGVARGKILLEDKELYRRLRGHA